MSRPVVTMQSHLLANELRLVMGGVILGVLAEAVDDGVAVNPAKFQKYLDLTADLFRPIPYA